MHTKGKRGGVYRLPGGWLRIRPRCEVLRSAAGMFQVCGQGAYWGGAGGLGSDLTLCVAEPLQAA